LNEPLEIKKAVLPGGRTAFAKVHLLPSIPGMKKKEKVGEAAAHVTHGFNVTVEGLTCQAGWQS
jgi:hypothetical protein